MGPDTRRDGAWGKWRYQWNCPPYTFRTSDKTHATAHFAQTAQGFCQRFLDGKKHELWTPNCFCLLLARTCTSPKAVLESSVPQGHDVHVVVEGARIAFPWICLATPLRLVDASNLAHGLG